MQPLMGDPDFSAWLRPGDTVMWGQANAEPLTLTRALVEQRHQFSRFRVFCGIGSADTLQPEHTDAIDFLGYAGSGTTRALAKAGKIDILPCHYSQLPLLIRSGRLRIDVVLVQVSPPDAHGNFSLGLAHEYLVPALELARVVIAEVNPDVPWIPNSRTLSADDVAFMVAAQHSVIDTPASHPKVEERAIGAHIAGLIEDGATLQIGIGSVPEAVLGALHQHRNLGLHSGAAGDGVADLAQAGVLNGALKNIDRGIHVAGLLMGGARLRKWAHKNPTLAMRSTEYTHHYGVLASIDKLVAINSAIEVDLTGQVNAEVVNGVYLGAIGGAMDFLRGAAASRGGLPIVALPSTAKGISRIVSSLNGPVSTPRADVGFVVTEHGVADLRGQSLKNRIKRMIDIAAPAHREMLDLAAHSLRY